MRAFYKFRKASTKNKQSSSQFSWYNLVPLILGSFHGPPFRSEMPAFNGKLLSFCDKKDFATKPGKGDASKFRKSEEGEPDSSVKRVECQFSPICTLRVVLQFFLHCSRFSIFSFHKRKIIDFPLIRYIRRKIGSLKSVLSVYKPNALIRFSPRFVSSN